MAQQQDLPASPHFRLERLTGGVFAAIAIDGGAAVANAGIVDLGDRTLIFDTFLTPQAARDLREAAVALTGHAPALLVNSHFHNDHIWGNQVFVPTALILASEATRALITTSGQEEYDWYSAQAASQLETMQQRLAEATDEEARQAALMWIGYYGGLVEALPTLEVCLPTVTFAEHCTLYGSKRRAELHAFTAGHTGDDTVLYLPDDGILFMSDLLFVGCHPFLAEGDPANLVRILQELATWDADRFVPGHGPVGSKENVQALIAYVETCTTLARELVATGKTDEAAVAGVDVPAPYRSWQIAPFFQVNMRFLIQRLAA